MVCGACGSSMIVRTRMRGVTYFGCSARMNRRGCGNDRNVAASEVEERVIAGLRKHLEMPEVIAAAVETYRAERQRLSREAARERGSIERELAETKRKLARAMDAMLNAYDDVGNHMPAINALSAQKRALEGRLAAANGPDVVELHPQAAERYAGQVAEIHEALADGGSTGLEAIAVMRELVNRITVTPTPRGKPVDIEIRGDLAALLNVNVHGTPVMPTMVAGVGFEPTTFRL